MRSSIDETDNMIGTRVIWRIINDLLGYPHLNEQTNFKEPFDYFVLKISKLKIRFYDSTTKDANINIFNKDFSVS